VDRRPFWAPGQNEKREANKREKGPFNGSTSRGGEGKAARKEAGCSKRELAQELRAKGTGGRYVPGGKGEVKTSAEADMHQECGNVAI